MSAWPHRKFCRALQTIVILLVLLASATIALAAPRQMTLTDRTRLAEAFRLADALGDKLWPDWSGAPFAVLLVTPEHEFLLRHPSPSADFTLSGHDDLLQTAVYVRKKTFPENFLATFPAVNGVSTIIVGQAENTNARTSTRWVVTLLHEHFHQLQDSQPDFFVAVNKLGLARGDQTGMWMLNFPFPYARPEVTRLFSLFSETLADAVEEQRPARFRTRLAAHLAARKALRQSLDADDYKYLTFQLWKEGVARYTEYQIARLAATGYQPGKEFAALPDFTPYGAAAEATLRGIIRELRTPALDTRRRESFYAVGAAQALLLDRSNPKWRMKYFQERFSLDSLFP